jgi:hypothetical protein
MPLSLSRRGVYLQVLVLIITPRSEGCCCAPVTVFKNFSCLWMTQKRKASKLLIKLNQLLLSYNVRSVWVIRPGVTHKHINTHKKNYFGFLLAFKRILRVSFSFFFYLIIWPVIVKTFLLSESPSPLVNDFKVKIWVCFSGMKKKKLKITFIADPLPPTE